MAKRANRRNQARPASKVPSGARSRQRIRPVVFVDRKKQADRTAARGRVTGW